MEEAEEEKCSNCGRWEEEMYWSHFQCIHFSQFLLFGFHQRLAIPEKFTRKLKKNLPEVVSLKGPSGYTWKVGLTKNNSTLFFNYGWQEFVKDNLLEENDFLIFKYNGESHFDVLIFDSQSMCEKAVSYFVKKSGNDSGTQMKRTTRESSVEATTNSPENVVGVSETKKHTNYVVNNKPFDRPLKSHVPKKEIWREVKFSNPFQAMQSVRNEESPTCAEETEAEPGLATSKRRVTKEDRENAMQLAQAAASNDGFIVVMKSSHVKRKYYLSLPRAWVIKHLSPEKQDVLLRFKGKTWDVKYLYREDRNHGGLSKGWKKFVMDNNLQEFDVCLFEPGSQVNNSIVLDVNIFHCGTKPVRPQVLGPMSPPDLEGEFRSGRRKKRGCS